jgi:hypothetical protein
MMEYLKNLLFSSNDENGIMFNAGFLTGVATAIGIIAILLLIRIIIALMFRRKKCSGITMQAELGDIFVSTSAITAAIRALESEFDALVIQKIRLFESKNAKVRICIQLIFDEGGGNFKLYSEKFQRAVLAKLKDAFGIENIDKVNIDNNTFNSTHKPQRKNRDATPFSADSDPEILEFQPQSDK